MARLLDRVDQRREHAVDPVGSHPAVEDQATGAPARVQAFADPDRVVGGRGGSELHAHGVLDAREELDVGAVDLTGPFTDPEEMGRAVVPVVGEAVAPGEGFLVVEQQRLVGGVEVDLAQL